MPDCQENNGNKENEGHLRWRIGPVPRESGLHMDGWFVWCGSLIESEGRYHLFASRWPTETGFPDGYRKYSEIIRADAATPLGPFQFREVVISKRDGAFWDGAMAHNPVVYRYRGRFYLFYIGSAPDSNYREIGLAVAERITGPWHRPDRPLDVGMAVDATNPAAVFEPDCVKLVWRTKDLRVCTSCAKTPMGPYRLTGENIFPDAKLEDFFFFKRDGLYQILCEDNVGKVTGHVDWGTRLVSGNGLDGWRVHGSEIIAYDHNIAWTGGGLFTAVRRERPWLLIENGRATALLTAIYDGKNTWNQPVPIQPAWPVD